MTKPSHLIVVWTEFRRRALPVAAALMMYEGIRSVLAEIGYPVTGLIVSGVNAIIRRGFRDTLQLHNSYIHERWSYPVRIVAEYVIVFVLGLFLALFVYIRNQRKGTP